VTQCTAGHVQFPAFYQQSNSFIHQMRNHEFEQYAKNFTGVMNKKLNSIVQDGVAFTK
jgi:hypothetical protein